MWIVGEVLTDKGDEWLFTGAFDDKQLAIDACTTTWHFVGPAILNERRPDGREEWPGSWYPMLEDEPA